MSGAGRKLHLDQRITSQDQIGAVGKHEDLVVLRSTGRRAGRGRSHGGRPAGLGPVALVVDGRAVRQGRYADHVGGQSQVCADQLVHALRQVWI